MGFLATLPPTKGVSDYAVGFLTNTPENILLDCYSISKLAPNLLYPGGDRIEGKSSTVKLPKNVRVRGILSYYGIDKWMQVGLTTSVRVFHIHWWTPFLILPYLGFMAALHIRGVKIVLTIHNVSSHENKFFHKIVTRFLLQLTDHVIVHTEAGKRRLVKQGGVTSNRISVLPHGLLIPPSSIDSTKKEAKEAIGIPADKKVLLFFGNIRRYKGLDILLNAVAEIVKTDSNVLLIVAGMPWKGGAEVRKQIDELDISKYVALRLRFIHPDELPLLFQCADLVVLPYRFFDAQTGVGAYALHFEKPMVVTNVGGLPSLVKDKSIVVPPNNVDELAKTITRVIKSPELMAKLSEDSKQMKKEFDWETIAKETVAIYEQLLGDS